MGKESTTSLIMNSSYRFWLGNIKTAILEKNGKLTLLDGIGQIEVWESWKDYVKDTQRSVPTRGSEDDVLEQLSLSLGDPVAIDDSVKKRSEPKDTATSGEREDNMANTAAAKAKKTPPAKTTPKVSNGTGKEKQPCVCGCGNLTGGNFAPGHDSRVHGWAKKLAAGTIKQSEVPATALKYIKAHA